MDDLDAVFATKKKKKDKKKGALCMDCVCVWGWVVWGYGGVYVCRCGVVMVCCLLVCVGGGSV